MQDLVGNLQTFSKYLQHYYNLAFWQKYSLVCTVRISVFNQLILACSSTALEYLLNSWLHTACCSRPLMSIKGKFVLHSLSKSCKAGRLVQDVYFSTCSTSSPDVTVKLISKYLPICLRAGHGQHWEPAGSARNQTCSVTLCSFGRNVVSQWPSYNAVCVRARVIVCEPTCVLFPTIEAFVDDLSNYWPKALLDQRTELTGIWLCVGVGVWLCVSVSQWPRLSINLSWLCFFGLFCSVFKNIVYSKYIIVFIYLLLCAARSRTC